MKTKWTAIFDQATEKLDLCVPLLLQSDYERYTVYLFPDQTAEFFCADF